MVLCENPYKLKIVANLIPRDKSCHKIPKLPFLLPEKIAEISLKLKNVISFEQPWGVRKEKLFGLLAKNYDILPKIYVIYLFLFFR